jgi:hypothetical protein
VWRAFFIFYKDLQLPKFPITPVLKVQKRREHMFDTLGIRTLLVCGAVTLMTLMTQQLLAESLLQITEATSVPEGGSGVVTFSFKNISNEDLSLLFSSLQSENLSKNDDFINITNPVVPGGVLAPDATRDVSAVFDTPQPDNFEDRDVGNNIIEGTVEAIGKTGIDIQHFSANVNVTDPGVSPVPESSTLVLVGVCALSVCGVGWLRRRRILSKA